MATPRNDPNAARFRVPFEALGWRCDESCFSFESTDEIPPLQEFVGQDRAVQAIEFGLAIDQPGYNIFVAGMSGTGKATLVKELLQRVVQEAKRTGVAKAPGDWCYVFNFDTPERPRLIPLPAGSGRLFKSSIERLHLDLSRHIEDAFSGEEYRQRRKLIIEETQAAQGQLLNRASSHAREQGFAFSMSASGATLIPLKNDRPVSEEDFQALPNEEREELRRRHFEVMQQIEPILEAVHELDHQAQGRLAKLEGDVAELAAKRAFEPIESQVGSPQAVEFLRELRSHAVEHVDSFREPSHRRTEEALPPPPPEQSRAPQVPIPFVVNVFVDNSGIDSPPIVVEDNPTFSNLFGRIDRVFLYGAYVTNHTLLRAGSISRANGGYLVLPLRQLLANPLAWESLKRVIKAGAVRPEDASEALGIVSPQSVRPEPMPLRVKIVVTGEAFIYDLLSSVDEEVWETFKVKADFDVQVSRSPEHLQAYAAFVGRVCTESGLLHMERSAVARTVEYASRVVADQGKLSTRFGQLKDLSVEANY